MTDVTYDTYESEDGDGNPITFRAQSLGHASSKRADDQPRWMEITIFKTEGSNYILEIVGQTNREGEVIKQRAHVFTDPRDVIEKLHATDDQSRRYITYTAREALFQAMDVDHELQEAWDKRARVVA